MGKVWLVTGLVGLSCGVQELVGSRFSGTVSWHARVSCVGRVWLVAGLVGLSCGVQELVVWVRSGW